MTAMDSGSLVYVAARPAHNDVFGEAEVVFELGTTTSEEVVGVAFTSAARLVEAIGPEQPWVCLPIGALPEKKSGIRLRKFGEVFSDANSTNLQTLWRRKARVG